jgi:hypothetical protein
MLFAGAPITTSAMPSIGSLLGSTGSRALIQNINDTLGSSTYFGTARDAYSAIHNAFIENIIIPIKQTAAKILDTTALYFNPDIIKALFTLDDFKRVPPSMQESIVLFQPVRELLEQGRVTGWGFNPEWLPAEDVYDRLINNGRVPDVLKAEKDEQGRITFTTRHVSTDPVLTHEQIEAIEETRLSILKILRDTPYDPTDIRNERG